MQAGFSICQVGGQGADHSLGSPGGFRSRFRGRSGGFGATGSGRQYPGGFLLRGLRASLGSGVRGWADGGAAGSGCFMVWLRGGYGGVDPGGSFWPN